jgi:peptide/nickel transport system permease protein
MSEANASAIAGADNALADAVPSQQARQPIHRTAFQRLLRPNSGTWGAIIVGFFVVLALIAPLLGLQDPYEIDIRGKLAAPSWDHLFGTDHYGRDLLSRVIYGTRASLPVAVGAIAVALLAGIVFGVSAGYLGGGWDHTVMRMTDVLMAFPSILLGMALVAALGPSVINIVIVIAMVQIPALVRLARADALVVKSREFVEASRAIGGSQAHIIRKHIIPNALPSLIVLSAVGMAQAVILEAAFGFLGLGVQPPRPSWGNLLADGREYMRTAPHTSIFPGIFVAVLALGFNLLGNGLRDYLDPRRK